MEGYGSLLVVQTVSLFPSMHLSSPSFALLRLDIVIESGTRALPPEQVETPGKKNQCGNPGVPGLRSPSEGFSGELGTSDPGQ